MFLIADKLWALPGSDRAGFVHTENSEEIKSFESYYWYSSPNYRQYYSIATKSQTKILSKKYTSLVDSYLIL